jgi:hypothetical protein
MDFKIEFLNFRWRLNSHPLFRIAYSRIHPNAAPLADPRQIMSNTANQVTISEDIYAQIKVPPLHLRYHYLNQASKQIIALAQ